ncbi:hypothetical protein BTO05_05185 [Winogradskyella sp. PC-19]|uniref:helix-turn-helix transcriptional regulator n=1 Tax=unclassified Winogradskyella TaxID=2615021 RepID=UPI000B3CAA1F|nr:MULTISPECIES: hypothetical protein [unclassified Winogradskyella]ARV09057.1 hypothetical protein BTO05_05185 [Winogradskyella sp. PC-19]
MLETIEYTVTMIVCLITAIVIQRIYVKEKKRGTKLDAINGIKWFGLAILVWGLGAFYNVLFVNIIGWSSTDKSLIYFGVVISLANSLCILLSLPSIEHNQERSILVRLVERFTTKEFIGLFSAVLGMIAFVFIATSYSNENISNNFIWLIDIPISVFVAISLLFELNKAFKSRQMKFMYLPTFALFLLIIIAVSHRIIPQDQVVQIIDQGFWAVVGSITSISFKFLFILLFSILLYSWKFLSEKEQQQSLVQDLTEENSILNKKISKVELANESHLDTIKSMKVELKELQKLSLIELSDRQKEVLANLALLGKDKSYPEIAEAMHISLDGFQTHIYQIKKLLNISGNAGKEQLINYAESNDLLQYSTLDSSD